MRVLLDTHALLWCKTDDPQLSSPVRQALLDASNEVWVSAASAWEIATKQRLGKLQGLAPFNDWFFELAVANSFRRFQVPHLLVSASFPPGSAPASACQPKTRSAPPS